MWGRMVSLWRGLCLDWWALKGMGLEALGEWDGGAAGKLGLGDPLYL